MKKLYHIFFIVFIHNLSYAQTTFQKIYCDTTAVDSRAMDLTYDGGFIITGFDGNNDMPLLKTDSLGNISWFKRIGTSARDWPTSIMQTSDYGFIITGEIDLPDPPDLFILKTDSIGNVLWTKRFTTDWGCGANCIIQTNDGGYFITGWTTGMTPSPSYGFLLKTDSAGNVAWSKILQVGGAYSVKQTPDGNYVLAGVNSNAGGSIDMLILKIDSSGNSIWAKTYDALSDEAACHISLTNDGGLIVTGGYGITSLYANVILMKTDSDGVFQWAKLFGGGGNDYGESVFTNVNGDFSIAGGSQDHVLLIKTDSSGNELWSKTYGNGSYITARSDQQQTNDGSYVLAASTGSFGTVNTCIYLIKTDINGNSGCNEFSQLMSLPSPTIQTSVLTQVMSTGYQIGPALLFNSINTGTVTTLCSSTGITNVHNEENGFSIYPNPSPGNFIIQIPGLAVKVIYIHLINVLGESVFSGTIDNPMLNNTEYVLREDFPPGFYSLEICYGENKKIFKLVKVK